MRPRHLVALVPVIGLLLAACSGGSSGPCGPASITLEATVNADAMEPSDLAVCRDQDVTVEITSQTDGELHLHGYDLEAELSTGETATLSFTADVAGQFIIEIHATAGEVEIGVLTVNEP